MHSGIVELLESPRPARGDQPLAPPPADEPVERRFLRLLADDGLIDPADLDLPLRVVLTDDELRRGAELLPDRLAAAARPVLALPGAGCRSSGGRPSGGPGSSRRCGPRAVRGHRARRRRPAGRARASGAGPARLRRHGRRRRRAGAGVAVGGDTGPVRLATAVGTPAVGLYGPTLAARYGLSDPASANLQGLPGCEVRRPTAITEQECWWSARCPLTATAVRRAWRTCPSTAW